MRAHDYTGKSVHLMHKTSGVRCTGTIIADPSQGETRFRTENGEEVGAYEWYYSLEEDKTSDDVVDRLRSRAAAFGVPKVSRISTTGNLLFEAAEEIERLREILARVCYE